MPHKSNSNYHSVSLSPPACLSACTLFPSNKHITCFTPVSMCKFISTQLTGQGLVTGHWPWRSSGEDSAISLSWPDFKLWPGTLLQATAPKATQEQAQASGSLSSIHLFILQILIKSLQCQVLTEEMNRDFRSVVDDSALLVQRARVQFLVGELRSHMSGDVAKKKEQNKIILKRRDGQKLFNRKPIYYSRIFLMGKGLRTWKDVFLCILFI